MSAEDWYLSLPWGNAGTWAEAHRLARVCARRFRTRYNVKRYGNGWGYGPIWEYNR